MKTALLTASFFILKSALFAQCPQNMTTIYSFSTNEIQYEIVKENLNWESAAACAVLRGGKLAEINSQQEQDSIFHYANQAGINASETIGWDGGGASYLWIGGNDLASEGNWVWNGDNSGSSIPFWIGTASGSPVNNLYSNWGNEPDNWNQQDALGFAITNWPLGTAGQWNDIFATNELYYIIEYPSTLGINETSEETPFTIFPNPAIGVIHVEIPEQEMVSIQVTDIRGKILIRTDDQRTIDISSLPNGVYQITVSTQKKTSAQLFMKQ